MQTFRGLIATSHTKQLHTGTERRNVDRDITGTTGAILAGVDQHYRYRCFRRDPASATEPVSVEHHIAGDEHTSVGKFRNRKFHNGLAKNTARRIVHRACLYLAAQPSLQCPARVANNNQMAANKQWKDLLAPRYWPSWLGIGLLRVAILLPMPVQDMLGRLLGRLLYAVIRDRRVIASVNIAACFPELPAAERKRLVKEHFESLGIGLFEMAMAWWASDRRLAVLVDVDGIEHLKAAIDQGKGAILLSAHFTTLEIGCRFVLGVFPFHPMYRHPKNEVVAYVTQGSRERLSGTAIHKDDVRSLLRSLKMNHAVWYAPDQAARGKMAADVPFFGIDAPTNLATSRLARMSGAPVLPFIQQRLDNGHYRVEILPPLDDFPSEDVINDAKRINDQIEQWVRRAPGQYLWIHRRFKGAGLDYPARG